MLDMVDRTTMCNLHYAYDSMKVGSSSMIAGDKGMVAILSFRNRSVSVAILQSHALCPDLPVLSTSSVIVKHHIIAELDGRQSATGAFSHLAIAELYVCLPLLLLLN